MKYLISIALFVIPSLAAAAEIEFTMIRFFDPTAMVKQRVNNVEEVGEYLKKSQTAVRNKLKGYSLSPASGFLVMAIRADGRTNAWLDMMQPVPKDVEKAVIQTAREIAPFRVKSGTLLVSLDVGINGRYVEEGYSPYPQEWIDYASQCNACGELDAETIVNRVWK